MIRYIIASHGRLAEGFLSALELFLGKKNIDIICAYVEQDSLVEKWKEIGSTFRNEDEIVVFTDLYGGSVNQFFSGLLMEGCNLHVITGINLGLLVELIVGLDSPVTREAIKNAVAAARNGLLYMNEVIHNTKEEETDE